MSYHRVGGYQGGQGSNGNGEQEARYQTPHPQDPRFQYQGRSPSPSNYEASIYRPQTMSPVHSTPAPRYTPSPMPPVPQQEYQLEDRPYMDQRPLEIPMGPGPSPGTPGDRLQSQPTYSVENVSHSYGHDQAYQDQYEYDDMQQQPQHMRGDYAFDPRAHHDAYYNRPYQPSPLGEDIGQYGQEHPQYFQDEPDTRPMLQTDSAFGPDPEQMAHDSDYSNGGYSDVPGRKTSPAAVPPIRRWKTVKEVQLFNGNLVLDCPVPPRLLNQVHHAPPPERDEFTHMRYTAATCDPENFYSERFTLRQRLFAKPRHTELFIVITMYNENDELFARTMMGVIKNIEFMNSRKDSKTWGENAWKKIVVCVVSDGRAKINSRTRAVLAALGVYQDGIAKQQVNGKEVTAHIYEYSTQMTLDIKNHVVQVKKGTTPIQMLFCLKEKNQKKINSHRWFFQAFGSVLDPNICVLLDCGTKPGRDSIYKLWRAFEYNPMCAGACGEIKAMLDRGKSLINPLVAAQNFEYKISNILDKPLESVFGFISVLPGAFSAYRYIALQNDKTGRGPLEKYFAGEKKDVNAGIFTKNMYLAEDRILCFELVAKQHCHWVLQYVKSATGETDVPTEMSDFIKQRRRWLNGSFFAAVYAITHSYQVFSSGHSFLRKLMFLLEFTYQSVNMLFAWFALANFFLVFRILTTSLGADNLMGTAGTVLAVIMEWLYLVTLVACFVLALGNRPEGSNKLYLTMVYFWVGIMLYLMFASIFITVYSVKEQLKENNFTFKLLFTDTLFFTLIVSTLSTWVLYLTMSLLFFDPWHMFTSIIQYLLLTPTYVNILNVYAFCNVHDVSWGTKGVEKPPSLPSAVTKPDGGVDVTIPSDDHDLNSQYESELQLFAKKDKIVKTPPKPEEREEDYYKGFRSAVVLVWMFTNLALSAVVLNTGGFERIDISTGAENIDVATQNSTIYMSVVLWSVAGLSLFRWVGSVWYLILRMFRGA